MCLHCSSHTDNMSITFIDGVEVVARPPDHLMGHVDFDNPQRIGEIPFFIILSIGFVIAALFFSQRLYRSVAIRKHLRSDDCEPKFQEPARFVDVPADFDNP